ncbi:ABC transporter related [Thermosinus carboxydivorans Nor1]|uniref:ABC transporter related n=1 Tax=Thermosinus carboxydivorans Nor1 TaxID=401526 RepID=A1HMJ8_9FIRM|nr:ABC transporter ATP-binding protein [Thermosinus carboxydivorans]EAX48490.1 ABC transporter related [Thermosinus carboxydivorans Nor1]
MLEVRNVSFAYRRGRSVLHDVSLIVGAGEFVAIAGRNGSGKTTLTRLIMSLLAPDSGAILVDGQDTRKATPADMARHIGYVFQNPDRQIFRETVAQEVAFGPEQLGLAPAEIKARVAEALALTGISDLANAYPAILTKGQKQRVAIASALALKPRMLILDEPTSGQDAVEREALLKLLTELCRQGLAILLITHDMEILARYVERTVVIADGRKVFDGAVTELFSGRYPVGKWGLRQPTAAAISREIAVFGGKTVVTVDELCTNLLEYARGDGHAKTGPAH